MEGLPNDTTGLPNDTSRLHNNTTTGLPNDTTGLPNDTTTTRLVIDLEQIRNEANGGRVQNIIDKAKFGYYDNTRGIIAYPKWQLVHDLQMVGAFGLASYARNGGYGPVLEDEQKK